MMLDPETRYRDDFIAASQVLAGRMGDDEAIAEDFDQGIVATGNRENRKFHNLAHFKSVSRSLTSGPFAAAFQSYMRRPNLRDLNESINSIAMRAGAHHDLVYIQADKGLPNPRIAEMLLPFIDSPDWKDKSFSLRSNIGIEDGLYRRTLTLFGLNDTARLNHLNGGNEFLSALYAGIEGKKAGIPEKYILAEQAIIEATRPFQEADRIDKLKERLVEANKTLDEAGQLTDCEIDAVMAAATTLSNHDVKGFLDYEKELKGGTEALLKEEGYDLDRPEEVFTASNKQQRFLRLLGKKDIYGLPTIFHNYSDLYLKEVLDEFNREAQESCLKEIRTLKRDICATALYAAVSSHVSSDSQAHWPRVAQQFESFVTDEFARNAIWKSIKSPPRPRKPTQIIWPNDAVLAESILSKFGPQVVEQMKAAARLS